jgi:hypothetical protein
MTCTPQNRCLACAAQERHFAPSRVALVLVGGLYAAVAAALVIALWSLVL